MSDADDLDVLSERIHGDLAAQLRAWGDGYLLTKFLVVAELIDQEGERTVLTATSKDMKSWETLGILEYARQLEQVGAINEVGE